MVSEEIHHLEEVTGIATAVGQMKQGAWTKSEGTLCDKHTHTNVSRLKC